MNKLLILFVFLLVSGCDANKEERKSVGISLDEKYGVLSQVEKNIRDVEVIQNNVRVEIGNLKEANLRDEAAVKENKDNLENYVMNHKAAVAAAAAADAGVFAILKQDLDEQDRGMLFAAGFLGAAYCLFSEDSCSDANAKVTYYGAQILFFENSKSSREQELSRLQIKVTDLENTKTPYFSNRIRLLGEIETLKSRVDALACHGPFCF